MSRSKSRRPLPVTSRSSKPYSCFKDSDRAPCILGQVRLSNSQKQRTHSLAPRIHVNRTSKSRIQANVAWANTMTAGLTQGDTIGQLIGGRHNSVMSGWERFPIVIYTGNCVYLLGPACGYSGWLRRGRSTGIDKMGHLWCLHCCVQCRSL
jgi:hypothetical protein